MSLTVILSNDISKTLEPGHIVCGVVKFLADAESYIESVAISFTGQTIVSLAEQNTADSSATPSSCGILFRLHLILERERHIPNKGTTMWPFAFRIPSYATFAPGSNQYLPTEFFEDEAPWRASSDAETLSLPPSMFFRADFTCAVHYGLHARLIRPPSLHLVGKQDLSAYASVRLRPTLASLNGFRGINYGDFQYIDCALKKKAGWGGMTQHLPLRSAKKGPERKSPNELAQTTLRLFLPTILPRDCHSPVRIFLRAIYSDANQQHEHISVRKLRLDLVAHTRVRAGWRQEADNYAFPLIRHNREIEIPLVRRDRNGKLVSITPPELLEI